MINFLKRLFFQVIVDSDKLTMKLTLHQMTVPTTCVRGKLKGSTKVIVPCQSQSQNRISSSCISMQFSYFYNQVLSIPFRHSPSSFISLEKELKQNSGSQRKSHKTSLSQRGKSSTCQHVSLIYLLTYMILYTHVQTTVPLTIFPSLLQQLPTTHTPQAPDSLKFKQHQHHRGYRRDFFLRQCP